MRWFQRALLFAGVAALAACAQGPGHTRALGTAGGTAVGAVLGAAASPCNRGGGALVGATLGLIGGTLAGDAIASDQECDACPTCGRRARVVPCPVPRRTVVRRKVIIVDNGVRRPAEEVVEPAVVEEPSDVQFGYGEP
jgi:hypothetical protein